MPDADPEHPASGAGADAIAAIATPSGRGGIGIVRISGAGVPALARAVLAKVPVARHATLCTARSRGGSPIDQGIALYFAAPHSYTGEPMLEFQGHGGPVVMREVLNAFLDAGARLANPGEFTQRAFLNDRLDLAQAEGVADLIDAASREAAQSALRSLRGEFSAAIHEIVAALTELRALTEAMLDFPEEDIDHLHSDEASLQLASVRSALDDVLDRSRQGSLLRNGVQVVLAGRPNAGKSSLLNCLAGEERAIVTAIPGTTRDALRETILIGGVPISLVDTAGLHEARDEVERLGVARTRRELAQADVVLIVVDAATQTPENVPTLLAEVPAAAVRICVLNKIDLVPAAQPPRLGDGIPVVQVSAKTGTGLDVLRRAILGAVGWQAHPETAYLARDRHLRALALARRHLGLAETQRVRWELFAEELRLAQAALGEITGDVAADDLLGEIFARFCIGK